MAKDLYDVKLLMFWDAASKRWQLTGTRGTARHSIWIETQAPIDHWALLKLMDTVKAEMESWLF